jgi:hypothetical protein
VLDQRSRNLRLCFPLEVGHLDEDQGVGAFAMMLAEWLRVVFERWRLIAAAVLVIGTGIVAVGRFGTLAGRYDGIGERMSEAEVRFILGPPDAVSERTFADESLLPPAWANGLSHDPLSTYFGWLSKFPLPDRNPPLAVTKSYTWRDGPAEVTIIMMRRFEEEYLYRKDGTIDLVPPDWRDDWIVAQSEIKMHDQSAPVWRARRLSERAWLALGDLADGVWRFLSWGWLPDIAHA